MRENVNLQDYNDKKKKNQNYKIKIINKKRKEKKLTRLKWQLTKLKGCYYYFINYCCL